MLDGPLDSFNVQHSTFNLDVDFELGLPSDLDKTPTRLDHSIFFLGASPSSWRVNASMLGYQIWYSFNPIQTPIVSPSSNTTKDDAPDIYETPDLTDDTSTVPV